MNRAFCISPKPVASNESWWASAPREGFTQLCVGKTAHLRGVNGPLPLIGHSAAYDPDVALAKRIREYKLEKEAA